MVPLAVISPLAFISPVTVNLPVNSSVVFSKKEPLISSAIWLELLKIPLPIVKVKVLVSAVTSKPPAPEIISTSLLVMVMPSLSPLLLISNS